MLSSYFDSCSAAAASFCCGQQLTAAMSGSTHWQILNRHHYQTLFRINTGKLISSAGRKCLKAVTVQYLLPAAVTNQCV